MLKSRFIFRLYATGLAAFALTACTLFSRQLSQTASRPSPTPPPIPTQLSLSATPQPGTEASSTTSTEEPQTEDSQQPATNLQAEVSCTETGSNQGIATLTWQPASPPGTEQQIVLALSPQNLNADGGMLVETLPAQQSSFALEDLEGQAVHYWQVQTQYENDWVASETAQFTGPTCVADVQEAEVTSTPTPSPTPQTAGEAPSPTPTRSMPTVPPSSSGSGTASNLSSTVGCEETSSRQAYADLTWKPADPRGDEQRIAVTIYRTGFENNAYTLSDPLAADQSSLRWTDLSGQAIHYWRVLTRYGQEWVASETAQFEGPTCVADYQQP